jgi:hypothetical protein
MRVFESHSWNFELVEFRQNSDNLMELLVIDTTLILECLDISELPLSIQSV